MLLGLEGLLLLLDHVEERLRVGRHLRIRMILHWLGGGLGLEGLLEHAVVVLHCVG